MPLPPRTRLVQQSISSLRDINALFNQVNETTGELTMVLATEGSSGFFVNIPSGCYVVKHLWGKFDSFAEPGFHFWLPPWYRLAYVISQHAMVYNAPVTACPTRDNVMIEINVAVTFQITSQEDAKLFVYNLGAHQFDYLLYGEANEALRALVRTVDHHEIYGLRGSHAPEFNKAMSAALKPFGITLIDTLITEARLPPAIKVKRQETSQFASKIAEQAKRQENVLLSITQKAERDMNQLEREKERDIQDFLAKKNRALLNRREKLVQAEAEKEVAIRKAQQDISTGMIAANAKFANAAVKVKTERLNSVEKAQIESAALLTLATQQAEEIVLKSNTMLQVETAKASMIELNASAELASSKGLEAKRAFTLELTRLKSLAQLAKSRPIVISGEHAEALLADLAASPLA
jgi:regulator of protease activity HflC (stomatin/prohibitin superfamily)